MKKKNKLNPLVRIPQLQFPVSKTMPMHIMPQSLMTDAQSPHHVYTPGPKEIPQPFRPQAVNALLIPKIPMPMNAPTIHNPLECVKSNASLNNCNATLAMIPAVTANMPP